MLQAQGMLNLRGRQTANKVLEQIKSEFVEISDYNYEPGTPSHRFLHNVFHFFTLTRWKSQCIPLNLLLDVISSATAILKTEHTLLHISSPPAYVIGDLHGNFKV